MIDCECDDGKNCEKRDCIHLHVCTCACMNVYMKIVKNMRYLCTYICRRVAYLCRRVVVEDDVTKLTKRATQVKMIEIFMVLIVRTIVER